MTEYPHEIIQAYNEAIKELEALPAHDETFRLIAKLKQKKAYYLAKVILDGDYP